MFSIKLFFYWLARNILVSLWTFLNISGAQNQSQLRVFPEVIWTQVSLIAVTQVFREIILCERLLAAVNGLVFSLNLCRNIIKFPRVFKVGYAKGFSRFWMAKVKFAFGWGNTFRLLNNSQGRMFIFFYIHPVSCRRISLSPLRVWISSLTDNS